MYVIWYGKCWSNVPAFDGELRGRICLIYIDDVIVLSPTEGQHLKDLCAVLGNLHSANITLNFKKCIFYQREFGFLGHIVSWGGVKVDSSPCPLCPTQFQVIFSPYNVFLVWWAGTTDLFLILQTWKPYWITWAVPKELWPTKAGPRRCSLSLPFGVHTDAIDIALGEVLAQVTEEGKRVIPYASRGLRGAE